MFRCGDKTLNITFVLTGKTTKEKGEKQRPPTAGGPISNPQKCSILEYFFPANKCLYILCLFLFYLWKSKDLKPFAARAPFTCKRKPQIYLMNIIHLFKCQAHYLDVYNNILTNYCSKKTKTLDPLTTLCGALGVPNLRTTELNLQIPSDLLSATLFFPLIPSLSHHMSQRINFSSFHERLVSPYIKIYPRQGSPEGGKW